LQTATSGLIVVGMTSNRPFLLGAFFLLAGCAAAFAAPSAGSSRNPVGLHGQLSIADRALVDERGQKVQLRGFSTHSLSGGDIFLNSEALAELRDEWKADVVRAAMYVDDPFAHGYIESPNLTRTVESVVGDATDAGLYVIIDWHILIRDRDPLTHLTEAKAFFSAMARKFSGNKNVFYEICNEPNGSDVTWEGNIRPYAEQVIAEIRRYDDHNIVIVGTPTWSQDVDLAAAHPLEDPRVMYTMHFYPGSHGERLRQKVATALKTVPVFCTEFGTTDNTGGGSLYPEELKAWMDFLDAQGISWCNWTLSNYSDSSAALQLTYEPLGDERMSERLTPSGKLIFEYMRRGRADAQ
jgi:endoglucanase